VPAPLEAWQPLLEPSGPFQIEHAEGTHVTYAVRGKPDAAGGLAQVKKPADLELVLYDETGNETRRIGGDQVIEVKGAHGPVTIVVVEDSVKPDPGETTKTRGA
jgi:hypothetical protein